MEPEVKSVGEVQSESDVMCSGFPALRPEKPNGFQKTMGWVFLGEDGLRAGWSIGLTILMMVVPAVVVALVIMTLQYFKILHHGQGQGFTPFNALINELVLVVVLYAGMALSSLIERKSFLRFYFTGAKGLTKFLSGAVGGFAAVSVLMGGLYAGGWLHYGGVALSGAAILGYAAEWGAAFLLVGFFEEGAFRGLLQKTLASGINFWWALGILAVVCGDLLWQGKGNGIWGVYIIAGLGLLPCLLVHLKKAESSGFWQAAWVTSTLFGFIHTGNGGENWIGIFSAAAIGFVFCVSIKLTGSIWWAIGFHAAWDWGLTYFYGAADSGNPAVGHYLSTTPVGSELWSGGADGPEGSLLIVPLILVVLAVIVAVYRKGAAAESVAAELTAS